ncbi:MAG TPA: peptide chain release factor N(5)-glutamine methyltransferase [Syntrophomonadaceae bacterium]|nr:peptide chain release factor N(5)-glutamine methyltransferase [Syntrophomonadaceae bacterium]
MKCRELLIKGTELLKKRGINSPRLDAEVLLASAWGRERADLLIFSEDQVPKEAELVFYDLLKQRSNGIPVAYLTGKKEFMSLDFYVNSDVLIPRPETELLVERVLEFLTMLDKPLQTAKRDMTPDYAIGVDEEHLLADVGTGSGAVAVSLAYYNPKVKVAAIDISHKALQTAARNAEHHGVNRRVRFLQGDLLTPLLEQGLIGMGTVVAANLPYIPTADLPDLPVDVQYEPKNALDGGKDGLEHYRRLIPQAELFLAPGGLLACEIGIGQGEMLAGMLEQEGWKRVEVLKDYAGRERVVTAVKQDRLGGQVD